MRLSLIVAVAENGVIGRAQALPWHLPEDLQRFKALTTGHPIVMGRKTHAAIGRPLPGRTNIVLTRRPGFAAPGVIVAGSFEAALAHAAGADEVFVIGGEALFRLALPAADRIYLTLVHAEVEGDARFPLEALEGWTLIEEERHAADGKHAHAYSFRVYERRPGAR